MLKGLLALHLPKEKANKLYNQIELYYRRDGRGIAINAKELIKRLEIAAWKNYNNSYKANEAK